MELQYHKSRLSDLKGSHKKETRKIGFLIVVFLIFFALSVKFGNILGMLVLGISLLLTVWWTSFAIMSREKFLEKYERDLELAEKDRINLRELQENIRLYEKKYIIDKGDMADVAITFLTREEEHSKITGIEKSSADWHWQQYKVLEFEKNLAESYISISIACVLIALIFSLVGGNVVVAMISCAAIPFLAIKLKKFRSLELFMDIYENILTDFDNRVITTEEMSELLSRDKMFHKIVGRKKG